ncbi:MAG: 5'/3'-nucleotidase SurE [Bacteroidales bacterium]
MSDYNYKRPLILISNDDAYFAKGLQVLIDCASKFGDVVVVAPAAPMSGKSHSITSEFPLRATLVDNDKCLKFYKVNGTPVDCIKLAFSELLDVRPDLVLTGINHGSNTSVNVLYSGTMGAAMEGCLHGVPSVGFSLCSHSLIADFSNTIPYIEAVIKRVLDEGLPKHVCLNINFPKGKIKGMRVCRQAEGKWVEEFDKRSDPRSMDYYWLTGQFESAEQNDNDGDVGFIDKGYASIVPVKVDMTDYEMIDKMKSEGWNIDDVMIN